MAVIQQQNFGSGPATQTFAFTPTAPAASGHLLGFFVAYRSTTNNGKVVASVADTATGGSNTYSKAVSSADAGHKSQADIWYVDPASSKSTVGTVTITFQATDTFKCEVTWYEADNVGTAPLDAAPTPTTGTSTAPSITTATLAQAAELAIGGIEWDASSNTESASPASPWVNAAVQSSSSPNNSGRSSYQITSATTALTYSNTIGSNLWHAVVATSS